MLDADEPVPYGQLAAVAQAMGLKFEYPEFGDWGNLEHAKRGWDSALALLREADAFIVDGFPLQHSPELTKCFHDRIASGSRALVFPSHSHRESLVLWSKFLDPYGIRPSWVKLVGPQGERSELQFRRDEGCFRSPELFAGIKTVVADTPFAVIYGGEALPMMVGAPSHWSVEGSTDFPTDWNARELAVIAAWYGDAGGAVIVAGARGLITDPVDLIGGHSRGIEHNKTLARNLLRFLRGSDQARGSVLTPENLCNRIEINLADFVLNTLKQAIGAAWWTNGVPTPIRVQAASRCEEEGNRLPKEAYLALIDLKSIMDKNWTLFEPHFSALGQPASKAKALAFFSPLNEIRRLVGHPLKKHVSGYRFSPEEVALLEEVDRLSLGLAQRVDPITH